MELILFCLNLSINLFQTQEIIKQTYSKINTRINTFLKVDKIIDFKAISLIGVPSQLFSMVISSFERSFIYDLEGKLEEFAGSAPKRCGEN